MLKEEVTKIFDDMGGDTYDKNNALFLPVQQNLHFLIQLVLNDLPVNARVLCVGVGTGADLIDLAKKNQGWSFVGIDPAASMLEKCKVKLEAQGLDGRCELFHGYLSDYQTQGRFDAVLCLFVMHFVKDLKERRQMYLDMTNYLLRQGIFIGAEICVETKLKSNEYLNLLENWKVMHGLAGAPKNKLDALGEVIETQLAVLSPKETRQLMIDAGLKDPTPFFQSLLIRGHWARR